eukprot:4006628-Prymnesium_polylepis.1
MQAAAAASETEAQAMPAASANQARGCTSGVAASRVLPTPTAIDLNPCIEAAAAARGGFAARAHATRMERAPSPMRWTALPRLSFVQAACCTCVLLCFAVCFLVASVGRLRRLRSSSTTATPRQ